MINYGRRIGSHEMPAYGTEIPDPFHPLSRGIVGHWLMNEGGGNTVYDISGHGNHGTLMNGPIWGGSKFGGGLSFDGSDDYVNVPYSPSLDITDAFAIDAWIKTTYGGVNAEIYSSYSTDSPYSGFSLGFAVGTGTEGKLSFWSSAHGSWVQSDSNTYNDGNWNHIVAVISGTTVAFYKNGVIDGTPTTAMPPSYTGIRTIGARTDGTINFPGSIGSLCIMHRVPSTTEIKQLCHDPFCNLLRVPIRRYSVAATGGLTILDYERAGMRGAFRGIGRGIA